MTPIAHLRWAKGGHAEILRVEGEAIEVRSTVPAPPGARLEATFTVAPEAVVKVKSNGSRKEPEGTFFLSGRLFDATRELRDRLAAVVVKP